MQISLHLWNSFSECKTRKQIWDLPDEQTNLAWWILFSVVSTDLDQRDDNEAATAIYRNCIYLPLLSLDKKGKDSRKPMLSSSGLETSAAVQMFYCLSARSDPEGFKNRQNGGELKKGERGWMEERRRNRDI